MFGDRIVATPDTDVVDSGQVSLVAPGLLPVVEGLHGAGPGVPKVPLQAAGRGVVAARAVNLSEEISKHEKYKDFMFFELIS